MDSKYVINFIFYLVLLMLIIGLISQYVWNNVISDIFSIRKISLIEALLINITLRICFQTFNLEDKD